LNKIGVCNKLHTLNFIISIRGNLLVIKRKYLNRKEDRLSTTDESTFVAEIGKKSEIRETMEAVQRSVTIGFKRNETETIKFNDRLKLQQKGRKTGWLEAMNAIRWALDAAGNTGQFIKFTNMKIDQHNEEIKNIKKLQDKFDKEIDMLQFQKLEKIIPNNNFVTMDIHTITSMLNQLMLGKRTSKSKLKTLESKCSLAEQELEFQEVQIDEVRDLLKEIQNQKNNTSKQDNEMNVLKTIKKELHDLSKDNDVAKLSNAIDSLL